LQASFRARLVRQQRSEIVSIIARRVHHANLRAREAPKSRLGCRTNLALGILQTSDKLSEIMEAAKTLEAATRLSSVCCKVFTEADASRILLDYVKKCNRSLPHMELALCVLLTLDNVTRYRAFIPSFADCFSAEVFLDEIQKFRDKDGIFCLSMDLLKRIADSNPTVMAFCCRKEHLKRLKGVHRQLSIRTTISKPMNRKKRENRMKRRQFFDRNQAMRQLSEMITAATSADTKYCFTF